MACGCCIVPGDVLKRFSRDRRLSGAQRSAFRNTLRVEAHWRELRSLQARGSALLSQAQPRAAVVAEKAAVTVYDCHHGTTLPGAPIGRPGGATDQTARRAFTTTTALAKFYLTVFGRNSVDGQGATLQSSIHYGVKYNNAFWNGVQMTYGDGDGAIFRDFTLADDVIGHELTHGVTQYSARLGYENEAGGLNESMSDVFGSMFRQWRAQQSVSAADWLIGADLMGSSALARGYSCLRDMAEPAASHCLAPQPSHYRDYQAGMDPHYSSGIPNRAFYLASMAIGGKSWELTGQIWYRALTGFKASPALSMQAFANRTRQLARGAFAGAATTAAAIDKAWKDVGL